MLKAILWTFVFLVLVSVATFAYTLVFWLVIFWLCTAEWGLDQI